MSIAKYIYHLKQTHSYRHATNRYHPQVSELVTKLSAIEQKGTPYHFQELTDCIALIDKQLAESKQKKRHFPVKLYLNAKQELTYFLNPLATIIENLALNKNIPDWKWMLIPSKYKLTIQKIKSINHELENLKEHWNQPVSEEVLRIAYKVIQQCDRWIEEDSKSLLADAAFPIKTLLIRKFFRNDQNENALCKEYREYIANNTEYEQFLVAPVIQGWFDESDHQDKGVCYGDARVFARKLLNNEKPFGIDPDISVTSQEKNYARVTEEIVRDQEGQLNKKADNAQEIRIRLGRDRYSVNPIEIATNLSALAKKHLGKPLLVDLKKMTGAHECVIRANSNGKIDWFDDNRGWYLFPNQTIFTAWFKQKYEKSYFKKIGYDMYQVSLVMNKEEYNNLPLSDRKKRDLKGKQTTLLTGAKYPIFWLIGSPAIMRPWFVLRKIATAVKRLFTSDAEKISSDEKQPLLSEKTDGINAQNSPSKNSTYKILHELYSYPVPSAPAKINSSDEHLSVIVDEKINPEQKVENTKKDEPKDENIDAADSQPVIFNPPFYP